MNNIVEENFQSFISDGNQFITERLGEIVPIYQQAFAGEPWFEISKCPTSNNAQEDSCKGGYSSLPVGDTCLHCNFLLKDEAYPEQEVIEKFTKLASTRPMKWYTEENPANRIALAAFVTLASAETISDEKYKNNNPMKSWLDAEFAGSEIAWLDEVFADKNVRERGNLSNFGNMICKLANALRVPVVAYRTINRRMLTAAKRDFGDDATIFKPNVDIPDHRYFIKIDIKGDI